MLTLELHRSRVVAVMLLLIHILAVISVSILSLSWVIKLLLIVLVLAHGIWLEYRYWRSNMVNKVGCGEAGWWCTKNAMQHWVQVLPNSVITRWFISLHLKSEDSKQKFYLLLLVWQYSPMEYRSIARQLRVGNNS